MDDNIDLSNITNLVDFLRNPDSVSRNARLKCADELERIIIGNERYEKVRRLTPRDFYQAWKLNISTGKPFDDIIDDFL